MLSEMLLIQIQSVHPDVKEVDELYFDVNDKTDYAVFAKKDKLSGKEFLYKVSYNFDKESNALTLGEIATQVLPARQYIDMADSQRKSKDDEEYKKRKRCKSNSIKTNKRDKFIQSINLYKTKNTKNNRKRGTK